MHELNMEETKAMFVYVAQEMQASKDLLTQADKTIGDGDHGVGMARGFEAVRQKIEQGTFESAGDLLRTIGTTLLMSIGGAAGAIFGTLFRGGAASLMKKQVFDSEALSTLLREGLAAVKDRGKAAPGDKTMVDALAPAALTSETLADAPLNEALAAVAEAAEQGMELTKTMVATMGKAKTLGKRTVGHPDPGALSTYLILKFMAAYTSGPDSRL